MAQTLSKAEAGWAQPSSGANMGCHPLRRARLARCTLIIHTVPLLSKCCKGIAIYSLFVRCHAGGCRAQELSPYLGAAWHIRDKEVVSGAKICSEVLVAVKRC